MATKKITKIDRDACRTINALIENLRERADELGLDLKVGGGKFDPVGGTFNPKVEFSVRQVDGVDRERAEFNRHAMMYGLKPEHFGAKFLNNGTEYALVGFELKKPKFSFRGRRVADGKALLFNYACLREISKEAYDQNKPFDVQEWNRERAARENAALDKTPFVLQPGK